MAENATIVRDGEGTGHNRSRQWMYWLGILGLLCCFAAVYFALSDQIDFPLDRDIALGGIGVLGGLSIYLGSRAFADARRQNITRPEQVIAVFERSNIPHAIINRRGMPVAANPEFTARCSEVGRSRSFMALLGASKLDDSSLFAALRLSNAGECTHLNLRSTRLGPISLAFTPLPNEHALVSIQKSALNDMEDAAEEAEFGIYHTDRDERLVYLNAYLTRMLDITDINSFLIKAPDLSALFTEPQLDLADGSNGRTVHGTRLKDAATTSVTVIQVKGQIEGQPGAMGYVIENPEPAQEQLPAPNPSEITSVFNGVPIAVAVLDETGKILEANDGFGALTGVEKPVGRHFTSSFGSADPREIDAYIKRSAEKGVRDLEPLEVHLDKDATHTAHIFLTRFQNKGRPAILSYALDVSTQKKLELNFAQVQKMQAVGQLAGNLAHDFNNLLTVIVGHADLLLQTHEVGDPDYADIKQIQANANRAANLVRQLLAFSRRVTLKKEVTLLTDLLSESSQMLRRVMGEKIKVSIQHGRDLWLVKIDQAEIDRVIVNLAMNARDAMPDGGELSIRTRNVLAKECGSFSYDTIMPVDDYVLVEVSDTGHGISKSHIGKIFEPFFTTKPAKQGTGLGLASVYGIVKQMGGFIFVDSDDDQGATFRIFLPRMQDQIVTRESKAEVVAAQDLSGKGRILLVEDEAAVRAFSKRALEMRGYEVVTATSGAEAVDMLKGAALEVDLIISDVVMPTMDGPTMMRALRDMNLQTKVIFISGYAEEAFRKNLRGDEEFTFLPKPFSLKELALKVKQALGS